MTSVVPRASALLLPALGTLLAAELLVSACGDSPSAADGGASDAGSDAAVVGDNVRPPTGTGNTLVDRLGSAAAKCGSQSSLTVPGGWQLTAIGDKGCMVHVPPGWKVAGAFGPTVSAFRDDTGSEGFVGLAGAAQASACNPVAVRDGVLQGFVENGYASPKVLWNAERNEPFGGSTWPTGHTVFSLTRGATPLVGYLWLLTTQTVAACDVVGLGFWEPESAIEADTCTLTEIVQSVRCPSGGGKEDGG